MDLQTVHAEMRQIWDTQEYRILPANVSRHMLQHSKLDHSCFAIWYLLYTESYFDKEWSIQLSTQEIADHVNLSKSATQNKIKLLVALGYLTKERKYLPDNRHYAATKYYVSLPEDVIEKIKQLPARKGNFAKSIENSEISVSQQEVSESDKKICSNSLSTGVVLK